MPRAGITHDITIRSYDRTIHRGFMLTRDRSGTRAFRRRDAQTIRPRILSMGELTHAELPPELELTWFQEDWSKRKPYEDAFRSDRFGSKYAWTAVMMYMLSHYDYLHE